MYYYRAAGSIHNLPKDQQMKLVKQYMESRKMSITKMNPVKGEKGTGIDQKAGWISNGCEEIGFDESGVKASKSKGG